MTESIQENLMLRKGIILHNTYRIVEYLASGGFGNTYIGEHITLGYRRAIKEFFMRGISSREDNNTTVCVSIASNRNIYEEQKKKFIKEAQRISHLQNSHIIKVHDLFEENNTCYYVMDLIAGESLLAKGHSMKRPFTEAEVTDITIQLLDALAIVHQNGLLHLDIKPGNIMIDASGHCTLIDFGSSKQTDSLQNNTVSTAMTYTPGYSPTEQITGARKRQGPWTDFYALGATIYKLLSDKTPPLIDDISADGEKAFDFPSDVSEKMRSLVIWMMKTDISSRPKNVDEIRHFMNATNLYGEREKTTITPPPVNEGKTVVAAPVVEAEKTVVAAPPNRKKEKKPKTDRRSQPFFKKHLIPFTVLSLCLIAAAVYFLLIRSDKPVQPDTTHSESAESDVAQTEDQPEVEKIAYNFGFSQSDGLKAYIEEQFGISSDDYDDFIEGMKEGADESSTKAYSFSTEESDPIKMKGKDVGSRVPSMARGLNQELFGEDAELQISTDQIIKGLADGLKMADGGEKTEKIKQATEYVEEKTEAYRTLRVEKEYGDWKKQNEAYLESNRTKSGVTTLASGVQYKILVPGSGSAMDKDSIVHADYVGKFIDGTEFDTSAGKQPIEIDLKHPNVIQGWVEVLKIMPRHAKWEVVIPSELAYGSREINLIKPFSTLIFIIETK